MSVSITGLSKELGGQLILNNISLEAERGDVVGFLGPNGAGKTTTMRIITGGLAYKTGSVKISGMEVKQNRLKVNSLFGYLPENNPLYPEMYVREYLNWVATTYPSVKDKKEVVEGLILKTGLTTEAHKKIGQLSKGYKQRVGLAQALIPDPEVLILDEPTTGLDPNQLVEIRELIRETGKNKTVILSTHILQEVQAVCNRVIIINQGEIAGNFQLNALDTDLETLFRKLTHNS